MSDIADLLERFRRGPELLAVTLTGAAGEEVDYSPAPGKWTIRQIVRHLADSEMAGGLRFRQVLAEDRPALFAFDQDKWAANLDYAQRKPAHSLDAFRRIRAENYELLKELPPESFERVGLHAVRGPITVRQLLELYANHAEKHAGQLQTIREAWKQVKGKK